MPGDLFQDYFLIVSLRLFAMDLSSVIKRVLPQLADDTVKQTEGKIQEAVPETCSELIASIISL